MAKMYYTLEEAIAKLGCTEDQIRGLVRSGQLREFRDAGKVNYRVDDVDKLATSAGDNIKLEGSGELSLEDSSGELSLADEDSDTGKSGSGSGATAAKSDTTAQLSGIGLALEGSDAPIDLDGSGGGKLSLEGSSGELQLEDSGSQPAQTGKPRDGGADVITLDEVDKNVVDGMKKDDTVITNIGISVFDDDDLEIAADPMAKTVMSGSDDGIGLDGSSAGSGLLDLTRESDDTSLGAELLEGIDMGDTAETVMKTVSDQGSAAGAAGEEDGLVEDMGVAVAPAAFMVASVPAASPAFAGLLIASLVSMALLTAAAIATTMQAWPAYLVALAEQFWFLLAGTLLVGGLGAGVGYLVGRPPSPPKPKQDKKGKKGKGKGEPAALETTPELDDVEPLA
ncbi:MAG TPA: helix-turn-helix domain-containing protein [Phycisphaerae bacterium]|nr:helix-turn-helix domain-containing protein [Phycisphaerae bacterium]